VIKWDELPAEKHTLILSRFCNYYFHLYNDCRNESRRFT